MFVFLGPFTPFPIVKSKRGLRFSKLIKWMSLLDLPSSNVHTLKILLNQRAWLCIFGLQAYLHGIYSLYTVELTRCTGMTSQLNIKSATNQERVNRLT